MNTNAIIAYAFPPQISKRRRIVWANLFISDDHTILVEDSFVTFTTHRFDKDLFPYTKPRIEQPVASRKYVETNKAFHTVKWCHCFMPRTIELSTTDTPKINPSDSSLVTKSKGFALGM